MKGGRFMLENSHYHNYDHDLEKERTRKTGKEE
jgi:hypothetical protein